MSDLTDTIESVASNPAEAQNAAGERVKAHDLTDLIKADQYLKQSEGVERKSRGLRFTKLVPPGAA